MTLRITDSLPAPVRDLQLCYEGFWDARAHCRLRLYRTAAGTPVIVLTEAPDNPSTSITNKAERAYYLAWRRLESPWPCLFVEHYPGETCEDGELAGEHLDWVEVAADKDGPRLVRKRQGGMVVCASGAAASGDDASEFAAVHWKPLTLAEFSRLIIHDP